MPRSVCLQSPMCWKLFLRKNFLQSTQLKNRKDHWFKCLALITEAVPKIWPNTCKWHKIQQLHSSKRTTITCQSTSFRESCEKPNLYFWKQTNKRAIERSKNSFSSAHPRGSLAGIHLRFSGFKGTLTKTSETAIISKALASLRHRYISKRARNCRLQIKN